MKKSPIALAVKASFVLCFTSLLGATSLSFIPSQALAQSADEKAAKEKAAKEKADQAKQEVIRPEWSKPYDEIQKLINDKQYPQALEKIKILAAFENKTPYEIFFLDRTRAVVANQTANNELLAASFAAMIKSDFLPTADKLKYTEAMAGTYFNEKKYKESLEWTQRYLAMNKESAIMQDLLVRNYYLQDDFQSAARELTAQVQADYGANRVPSHDRLRLLFSAQMKLKDQAGSALSLERLVTHHPKKEYWADLLYRLPNKPGFSDRLRLDWYRLLLTTENLEDAAQYVEMAELAIFAGFPLEAKNALDTGYKANVLGTGKNAVKHKQLLDKANKQVAEDAKTLDAGEASAKASKAGTGMVNMGYNLVTHGQTERGIALMEQGFVKGGLKAPEEAKLHLGMAYLQAGNKAKAAEVFKTIQGNDGSVELGKYWLLLQK
jgi:hypothetical protein